MNFSIPRDMKIGLGIFVLLCLFGILFIHPEPPKIGDKLVYIEEPLHKNRNISFAYGQTFNYAYTLEQPSETGPVPYIPDNQTNKTGILSFATQTGVDCTWLYHNESGEISCLKPDGTDLSGSNLTLEDPSLVIFKPWMLALDDNWKWKVKGCFTVDGQLSCEMELDYRVLRVDYENGKKYYVVETTYGENTIHSWVEDERRILKKQTGPGFEITLRE